MLTASSQTATPHHSSVSAELARLSPGGPGRGGGSWPCGAGGPAGINIVYTEPLHQLVLDITADKMKVSYYNYMTKTPSDLEVQLALRQSLYSDD